jgi:hypothetical protein
MGTDPYVALASELNLLGRRLDWLGAELLRLRAAGAAGAGVPGTEGIPGTPAGAAPVAQQWPVAHERPRPPGTDGPE